MSISKVFSGEEAGPPGGVTLLFSHRGIRVEEKRWRFRQNCRMLCVQIR